MNPKTTIILIAALVLAVIGVWWAQSSADKGIVPEKPSGPQALFEPALGELTGFELSMSDGPTFAFAMTDQKWRMTAPMDAASEHFKVAGDARQVSELKYSRAYRQGDADRPSAETTQLDNPPRIVKLTDQAGKAHVVKIGAAQPLSRKTYVQKEGDGTIYLVDADLHADLRRSLADYRGKRITEFNQADAVRVEVMGERPYTLVKTDGKWMVDSPVKGRADAAAINNIVRAAGNLAATEFVEDAPTSLRPFGLETPRLRIAVTTETKKPRPQTQPATTEPAAQEFETETKTYRLAFGGTAGDKAFAKLDEASSPAVFQVASSVLDSLNVALEDVRDQQVVAADTRRAQKITVASGSDAIELFQAGGKWQITGVEGPGGTIDAEPAAVDDLLKALRELKATGFESTDSPAFGFSSPRAAIQLTVEGQVEPVKLTVGGLTPSKTGAYVRNEGEGFIAVVKAESAEALAVHPMAFRNRELLRFDRNQATRIEIVRGGATSAVAQEAGEWKFVAPVTGAAEAAAVNDILADLSGLRGRKVVGAVTEAPGFGLDKPSVQVTVTIQPPPKPKPPATTQPTTEPASQPVEETLEIPPPIQHTVLLARQGDKVYATTVGGQTICEVDAKVLEDLEAELLETSVATIDSTKAQRLSYGGAGSFAFEKKGNEWTLVGESSFAVDPAKVTPVFDALRDLRADRYVQYTAPVQPAAYGLETPAVVLTAQAEGGEPITLMISAAGPGGDDRFASVSTAPERVFVLKAADATKFIKQVQDFQKGS